MFIQSKFILNCIGTDNKDARSKGESFSFLLTYGEDVLEDYVDLKKVYKFSMLF